MMPKVAVLMSTYNGEKYIREQIDSILAQKEVEVVLFIRDDGSTDNTISIIKEQYSFPNVKLMIGKENLKPGMSFMTLLEYVVKKEKSFDFYAFSDQDDIWLEDKLIVAIKTICDSGYSGSVLYSSNQFLYINGVNAGKRHIEKQSLALIPHITKNTISGCTFVLNKELAELIVVSDLPDPKVIQYRLHDSWIMLICIICGHVIYDEGAHMLYRIHENNVVGIKKAPIKVKLNRLENLLLKKGNSNVRMITAKELLRLFPVASEDDKRILHLFADYSQSFHNKIELLSNKDILRNCGENTTAFKIKILLGWV